ncbi:Craniofacial development protein 2 [Chionoecetes opilio]|uniref:Craniofacial development protein 2 n=1 Tax=Chionoecetes opilio TaxID=41210 RepID=A0A8J5CPH2_CHIOP|nr:Craniofacial development protein 2 [Chionoecetes opilio]
MSVTIRGTPSPDDLIGIRFGKGDSDPAWLYALRPLVSHTIHHLPQSQGKRVFMATWWLGCFILTTAYTANLIAYLTIPAYPERLQTVEQLAKSPYRNTNSSLLLNFARSRRLRIAGSWHQRPELHRWTWYSNAGGVAKEIDHILVSTRWRILQNCRVYRSAEFFGTDHRLVVATLKLHVKSRRISRGNHTVFHLEKLKDLTCAHEYAVAVSNRFDVLGALGDPVELWDTFKRETLQAAKECIGERPRSRRGFVSTETLEKIEESRAARLAGNRDQHRALSRRTRTLLGRDKERYVRSLAEDVEGHLNANDLRPAYRALKKLRSKSPSRASAIRTADGRLVSDMDGQKVRWAEYFGQLFTVDPPNEQLHTTGLQAVDADPPIDKKRTLS